MGLDFFNINDRGRNQILFTLSGQLLLEWDAKTFPKISGEREYG